MKTIQGTLMIAAVFLLFVGNVVAASGTDTKISVRSLENESKKALIRVASVGSSEQATLRIKDENGRTLYRETLNGEDAYMKKYDFSRLPSGEYVVEVRTANGTTKEAFSLNEGAAQAVYFKPAIKVEPQKVSVVFKNQINSSVSLKLFDQDGRVLYEERVASQEKFAKGLDLSKLNRGQYSLAILGNNYVYTKSIDLK
ncbi:hypothetical protein [Tunicatimonas pelagia]|uniref:hypothetical protein n=1 Tax=Tunicatimonas pelagia TaxID=931531 RepID=UPI0026656208|nr:hypothetical protein [Tunicatimonas pelagia]WKN45723.1 hypothetical protein P0M28_12220 [Tunicatimonas pelagia]